MLQLVNSIPGLPAQAAVHVWFPSFELPYWGPALDVALEDGKEA